MRYDPEVFEIEAEIINNFINSPMFSGRDEYFVRILVLFITRESLTQKELKRITGLSSGTISQELQDLEKDGLIEVIDISEKGKKTYRGKPAGVMLLRFSLSVIVRLMKWESKLKEKYNKLISNQKELSNYRGYNRLVKIYDYMINSIGKYEKFNQNGQQILKKLENKK